MKIKVGLVLAWGAGETFCALGLSTFGEVKNDPLAAEPDGAVLRGR